MDEETIYGQDQQIRIAILKDIQSGRNPFFILNYLLDYVAEKSGEPAFAKVAKENIRSVYGIGLGQPELLAKELQEVNERSQELQAAYNRETSDEHKKRIEYAIIAHRNRSEQLQQLLKTTTK